MSHNRSPSSRSSAGRPNAGRSSAGRSSAGRSDTGRSNAGPSQRQLRVGELLRHALSEVLTRGDVRDPDLDGVSVTITQVKPSPDMRHATVFCEPLGGRNVTLVLAALNRHRGFIRGAMGKTIALKFTPDLRFVEDTSFSEAEKIETLLKSERVARDLAAEDEPANEDAAAEEDDNGA